MKIKKKIKGNIFTLIVIFAYLLTFIFNKDIGISALKNSIYYFKELISIMPVILVLTSLLDFWVPKKVIVDNLGNSSGFKGIFYSFVLGSISAGPIYAAFPISVMLLTKGASIRNIIIILSSWAVIKIPMLVNEVKFLGPSFMIVRWVLTVIAIIIYSYIASKIVKNKDIPKEKENQNKKIVVNRKACMGCSLCAKIYPKLFEMNEGKAALSNINFIEVEKTKLLNIINKCPSSAITIE